MNDSFIVPTIDISAWSSNDPATRDEVAEAVDAACRSIGFMQIVGHGIPPEIVNGLGDAIDTFFDLPDDTKASHRAPRPSINRGYSPPAAERLSYSLGIDSPADMFEAFNIGAAVTDFVDHGSDEFDTRNLDPEIYASNIWPDPDAAPDFEPNATAWFQQAGQLARTITSIMAHALDLEERFFEPYTDHSIDVLRMVNYALPEGVQLQPDQLGMGAHTDFGIVTVLWADPVPGLEILGPEASWHSVIPAPDAILVNLGDLLEQWTNDRYTSTMHRVVPPTDAEGRSIRRRSAAFFHDGNADALISTISSCRETDGTSSYTDVTVAEHLSQKLSGSRGLELNTHAQREAARIEQPRKEKVDT